MWTLLILTITEPLKEVQSGAQASKECSSKRQWFAFAPCDNILALNVKQFSSRFWEMTLGATHGRAAEAVPLPQKKDRAEARSVKSKIKFRTSYGF